MDPVSEIALHYGHSTSDEEVEKSVAADENLSRPSPSIAPSVHSRPQDDGSYGRGMNPEKSSSSKIKQKGDNGLLSAKRLPISRRRAVRRRRPKLRATEDEDDGSGGEDLKFRELMALIDNAGRSDAVDAPPEEVDEEPCFVTAPETLAATDSGDGVRNLSDGGNAVAFDGNSALGQSPAASPAEFIGVDPTSLPTEDLGFEKAGMEVSTRCSVQSVMKTLLDVVGVLANESEHGVGDENIIQVAKRAGYVFPQPQWRRAGGYS
ncbi:hypothetical protein ACLOJK_030481 [Asimina triloba]